MALQTIPSRNIDPVESSVISIGFMRGGSAYNVIPDELHIGGTVRSFRPEVRDTLERRMGEVARGTAALHGATAECEYRRGYPSTINHAAEAEFAADVAAEICGPDKLDRHVAPSPNARLAAFAAEMQPAPASRRSRHRPSRSSSLARSCGPIRIDVLGLYHIPTRLSMVCETASDPLSKTGRRDPAGRAPHPS